MVHFWERILPVESAGEECAANLIVQHQLTPFDALIGATAQVNGLILAAGNVTHLQTTEIEVLNPWNQKS